MDIKQRILGLGECVGLSKAGLTSVISLYPLLFVSIKVAHVWFSVLLDYSLDELPGILLKTSSQLSSFSCVFLVYLLLLTFALKANQKKVIVTLSFLMMTIAVIAIDTHVVTDVTSTVYINRIIKIETLGFLSGTPLYLFFCWFIVLISERILKYLGFFALLTFMLIAGFFVPVVGFLGVLCAGPVFNIASQFHLI